LALKSHSPQSTKYKQTGRKYIHLYQAWWFTSIIPALALGRPKQEDQKFKASLGNLARPVSKKKKKTERSGKGVGGCVAQAVEHLRSKP
jgi:hypothetical protein